MKYKIGPFLKWAGGKKQILDKLEVRVPEVYNRYYEPFIGAGALLFHLQPEKAVICDTNEQLVNLYRQIRNDVEQVISLVQVLDDGFCDVNRYKSIRLAYNKKIQDGELDIECAAFMIWLNKHCFNGLYRVNSKGLFNVPFNNKNCGSSIDEDNLRNISLYFNSNDVKICQGDFEKVCADIIPDDFVYFDPPYIPVSDSANFTDYTKCGFSLDDNRRLAVLFKKLSESGVKVMLSNNDVPAIHELYSGFRIESIGVRRAINCHALKRVGKEVIITNY